MRGRKVNADLVGQFIIECAANNKTTPPEIYTEAINQLKKINRKLSKIDILKKKKNILEDVLKIVGDIRYDTKTKTTEDAKSK